MLSVHPEEWRKQWFSMIPTQRLCDTYELKGVSDVNAILSEAYILRRHTSSAPRMPRAT